MASSSWTIGLSDMFRPFGYQTHPLTESLLCYCLQYLKNAMIRIPGLSGTVVIRTPDILLTEPFGNWMFIIQMFVHYSGHHSFTGPSFERVLWHWRFRHWRFWHLRFFQKKTLEAPTLEAKWLWRPRHWRPSAEKQLGGEENVCIRGTMGGLWWG